MAIYTKRGDGGETSLYDSDSSHKVRISKNSLRINAIGTLDELNSFLGIVGGLKKIQSDLFTINSIIAGSRLRFSKTKTRRLEKEIDKIEGKLPVLKNFIFYGGTEAASRLFFARALCRRAERQVFALDMAERLKPEILSYLNRLSDYLFMLARKVNYDANVKEEVWKRK